MRQETDQTLHELLDSLNPQQREAVCHGEGPLLVLAGAGSGKTRVLTHRLAYLVRCKGISPWSVMAVTFTNKAAGEMKERAERLVGGLPKDAWVGTFHSLCARMLRRHGSLVGVKPSFTVFDDSDQLTLIRECLRELNLDEKQFPPRPILSAIGRAKDELVDENQFARAAFGPNEEIAARIYRLYQKKLAENDALDFDDLIMKTVQMLRDSDEAREYYQNLFRYILIDEYQDINTAQYVLVRILAEPRRNVCAVGDDDQSIYAFRGANVHLILNFERDYPEAKIIKLEQNYRSTKTILDGAWHVVKENRGRHEKRLWTEREAGDPIYVYEAEDERDEAAYVIRQITEGINSRGMHPRDFAVLYRVNAQSRVLEEEFLKSGVPYRIVGGLRFYERKEIKDALAYLRIIHNPNDSVSLQRILNVPPRGIGSTTISRLSDYAALHGQSLYWALSELDSIPDVRPQTRRSLNSFFEMIEDIRKSAHLHTVTDILAMVLDQSGYLQMLRAEGTGESETKLQNLEELFSVTREFEASNPEPSLGAFLERVSLISDADTYDESVDSVVLMTLHAAKGLEFPEVFIVGMEEGLLPFSRSVQDEDQLEEERRLCYVGMTRAMNRLHLIYVRTRALFGDRFINPPSRFLQSIPPELTNIGRIRTRRERYLSARSFLPERGASSADQYASSITSTDAEPATPPFRDGCRVCHPVFGEGIVVSSSYSGSDWIVTVVFDDPNVGMKKLSTSYAKLKVLG